MAHYPLKIDQLSKQLEGYEYIKHSSKPTLGWVKAIRTTLGISLEQLGTKLGITRQSTQSLEVREAEGRVTLKSMEDVAAALDMEFVYGFVPKDGSLEKLIERKAREMATEIVMRTSRTMKLEDQENSKERIKCAIEERTADIISKHPKALWD